MTTEKAIELISEARGRLDMQAESHREKADAFDKAIDALERELFKPLKTGYSHIKERKKK